MFGVRSVVLIESVVLSRLEVERSAVTVAVGSSLVQAKTTVAAAAITATETDARKVPSGLRIGNGRVSDLHQDCGDI